jgi:hypothetical protein
MKIEVLYNVWVHDDDVFVGGLHEIEKPSKKLLAAIAAAEDAGVLKIEASKDERKAMAKHVQSQEAGEAANAKVNQSDEWKSGNLQQFLVGAREQVRKHDDEEDEYLLADGMREWLVSGIVEAEDVLEKMQDGASYEDAVVAVKAA